MANVLKSGMIYDNIAFYIAREENPLNPRTNNVLLPERNIGRMVIWHNTLEGDLTARSWQQFRALFVTIARSLDPYGFLEDVRKLHVSGPVPEEEEPGEYFAIVFGSDCTGKLSDVQKWIDCSVEHKLEKVTSVMASVARRIIEEHTVSLPLYLSADGKTLQIRSFPIPEHGKHIGFIYVPKAELIRYGNTLEEAEKFVVKAMEKEVATYEAYIRGDVYSFSVHNVFTHEVLYCGWNIYGKDALTETIRNTVPPEFQPSMLEDWKF